MGAARGLLHLVPKRRPSHAFTPRETRSPHGDGAAALCSTAAAHSADAAATALGPATGDSAAPVHASDAHASGPHAAGRHPQVGGLVQRRAAPRRHARCLVLRLPPLCELLRAVHQRLLQLLIFLRPGACDPAARALALAALVACATDVLALRRRGFALRAGLRLSCCSAWRSSRRATQDLQARVLREASGEQGQEHEALDSHGCWGGKLGFERGAVSRGCLS
mmetsp:Transcript_90962/g.278446  ORF Transcript_90962/g.278446 Transcript_90962/m.278446 type:complete len:223 (+) Transcript_90962:103-771(+)